jgi:hypothetical protein
MFLILLAFSASLRRHGRRGRRGRVRRPPVRTPTGLFHPRSVPPDTASIITFANTEDGPLFVRVGGHELGEGFIGDGGHRAIQLPPLPAGEHLVQRSSDNATWVTVGVLQVKPPGNWAAMGAGIAFITAIVVVLWWLHDAETRKKRQRRSDEGVRYERNAQGE